MLLQTRFPVSLSSFLWRRPLCGLACNVSRWQISLTPSALPPKYWTACQNECWPPLQKTRCEPVSAHAESFPFRFGLSQLFSPYKSPAGHDQVPSARQSFSRMDTASNRTDHTKTGIQCGSSRSAHACCKTASCAGKRACGGGGSISVDGTQAVLECLPSLHILTNKLKLSTRWPPSNSAIVRWPTWVAFWAIHNCVERDFPGQSSMQLCTPSEFTPFG